MDLLPFGFLVLIVLMSGGIAVLADDLGRRLGKKRLHIKGLRPKRVAQIGTFLAGIFVSLATILVVAVGSSGVRRWILEGNNAAVERDAAIRQRDRANKERAQSQRELAKIEGQRNALRQDNSALGDLNRKFNLDVSQKQSQLTELHSQIGRLEPQIALLQGSVTGYQRRIETLNTAKARAESGLKAINAQLRTVTVAMAQAKAAEETALATTAAAIRQKKDTDEANQALLNDQGVLKREVDGLKDEAAALQQARDSAEKSLDQTKLLLAQNLNDLKQTEADLKQAKEGEAAWGELAQIPRYAPMMFRRGDEVARISVDAGLSFEKAQAALTSLVRSARVAAGQAGAKANGQYPEAGIFDHQDQRTQRMITTPELEREIVDKVAGAAQPMVLVARSSLNAFMGEPVSLEIEAAPNPVVYRRNDIVAEANIDGRKDPATVLQELSDLGEKVRKRAKHDKMIARMGAAEQYGAVSSEEVLKLVNQVKASDRQVRVCAVVEDDTRAGDPLKLKFSVH